MHPGYGKPGPTVFTTCFVLLNFGLCIGIISSVVHIMREEHAKEEAKKKIKKVKLTQMVSDSFKKSVEAISRISKTSTGNFQSIHYVKCEVLNLKLSALKLSESKLVIQVVRKFKDYSTCCCTNCILYPF